MPNSEKIGSTFADDSDSRRLLNQIIGVIPNVVYIRDLHEQKNIFISRSVLNVLGYDDEEVVESGGDFVKSVMHPEDYARLPEQEGKFDNLKNGDFIEFQYRMRHRNGDWIWFLSRDSIFLRNQSGQPLQVIGTATDITSLKITEEKLIESEDRFQLAFAAVQAVIYDWNIVDDTITRSAELKNLLGFDNSEPDVAHNKWWLSRLHPADAERATKLIKDSIEKGLNRFEDEYRLRHKAGHFLWVNDSGVFLKNENGQIVRCIGSVRNINYQKQTEEALREEKQFTESIITTAPTLTYIFDITTQTNVFINPLSLEVLGYTPEEIREIGSDLLFLLIHPDDKEKSRERFEKFLQDKTDETYDLEYRMRRKDRNYVWLYDRARVFRRDSFGKPTQILGVATDVTLRKAAEEARQQFVSLIEETNDFVGMAKLSGEVIYTNPAGCQLVGLDEKNTPRRQKIPDFHPASTAKIIKEIAIPQVLEKGLWEGESQLKHFKTGEIIDIYQKIFPIRNPQTNELICLATIAQNITERKRQEAAAAQLVAIVASSSDAILSKTLDGVITSWNAGAERMFGYTAEEIVGSPVLRLIPLEHHSEEKVILARLKKGEKIEHYETVRLTKDNRRLDVSLTISPLKDSTGKIIGASKIIHDFTERKRREENLSFLAAVSKDFAPLSSVAEILEMTGKRIGEYLGLSHCGFVEINEAQNEAVVLHDENVAGMQPITGVFRLTDFYHETELRLHAAGKSFAVNDVGLEIADQNRAKNFEQLGIRALLNTPYIRDGQWKFVLCATRTEPYQWQPHEIELLCDLAERIYVRLERARTEEKLRESEDRYRTLFSSIDEGYCIIEVLFDAHGRPFDYRFVEINPAFEKQTGLTDAIGKTMLDFAPQMEKYWFEIYGKVVLTGEPVRFENEAAELNRWFDVYAFRYGQPEKRQVAVLFNDITTRKHTEETLRESEEIFRVASDAAAAQVYNVDLTGKRTAITHGLERVTGYSAAETELTADWWHSLIHPDDLPAHLENLARYLEKGDTYKAIHRLRRKDGEYIWVEDTAQIVRDEKGTAIQLVGAVVDINERKTAEIALRKSEERLRIATNIALMFSWETDLTTNKIKWSDNAAKVINCSPDDLSENNSEAHFFILPKESERLIKEFKEILASGKINYASEFRGTNDRYWQAHGLIVRDSSGNPLKVIGVTQDITERKRYEEKLQTANYRFRIAEEAAQGFSYEWNLETGRVTRSESIERVIGYPREELEMTWQAWVDLIHPDDLMVKSEAEAIKNIRSLKEETFSSEYRVRHKNGTSVWLMERGLIIRDEAENPVRVIGQTVDITARKEQEEKIRESEERYRALVEASAQVVWTMAADGSGDSHLHWFAELIGQPLEELKSGKNYLEYIHPDDRENLQNIWQQIKEKPAKYEAEFRLESTAEGYRYYNLRGVPLLNEDGTLREWIGTVKDITETKLAEENLRESEQYRRLLIESARDYAIIGISIEGRIQSWNRGAEIIFGYKEDEVLGKPREVLFTPEDCLQGIPQAEMETILQQSSHQYERWYRHRNGSAFFASGVVHQLQSQSGKLLGFVKIARDQTEKLAAEKALNEREMLKKLVGALEDERRRIARDLHDGIGQELTALRLKLEHIRRICDDEEICDEIDKTQNIAATIDKGVDFIAWEFRPAALDDLGLTAALDKFVHRWSDYSGVSAELSSTGLDLRLPSEIETNLYRIAQEALNNIHKHAQAKNAEIWLQIRNGKIILIIADDGIGFNADSIGKQEKGLGLTGMQERAALIGGTFEVESAPGKGTTIYIHAPISLVEEEKSDERKY